jgi:hypothetical protein
MTCTLFTKTIVFAKLITVLISIILTLTSCSVTNSKKKAGINSTNTKRAHIGVNWIIRLANQGQNSFFAVW